MITRTENPFNGPVYRFESTTSVMDDAKTRMEDGALLTADHQTKGRGRLETRSWINSPGRDLLMALILKERDFSAPVSLLFALGVAKTLESRGFLSKIKWPNDILINEKKVCGILCLKRDDFYVTGVGINVNGEPELDTATSLIRESGIVFDLPSLLKTFLNELKISMNEPDVIDQINDRLWRMGLETRYTVGEEMVTGKIEGVLPDGSLRLGGRTIYAGESTLYR